MLAVIDGQSHLLKENKISFALLKILTLLSRHFMQAAHATGALPRPIVNRRDGLETH